MCVKSLTPILLGSLILLVLLGTTVAAQQLPKINYEKYELANGLDVILHEDHSNPTVAINIWYHVGSKNERPGRTGFAHLFEHMMFQGSKHHDTDYFLPLEQAGGEVNGSTSEDRTNYWENLPSNCLEIGLWLEADRMGWLVPAMNQERLDNQRSVVQNERRQGVENQPYGKVEDYAAPLIFGRDHPYSWSVIGSMEDLSAASFEDITNFFKQYYTPNNASLCIAGDFDPVKAKALVEKYFAEIPPGPPVDRMTSWVPVMDGVRRVVLQDNVSLPRLYMYWHTPASYKPGDAEFDIISSVLSSGKTSRLYKALVYEQQIAQEVYAYQESRELSSIFTIIATAKEGHTLDEIEKAIDVELRKLLAGGVTQSEIDVVRTTFEAGFVRALEPVGGFGGRADKLNEYNTAFGDPDRFQWNLDRYNAVTIASVAQYAKQYLDLNRRGILYVEPFGDKQAATGETDRSQQPAVSEALPFKPPMVQQAILSNGLKVMVVENHRLPLVQANLVIKSGSSGDPADAIGSAVFAASLLDEGTKTLSALQISERARQLGANLGAYATADATNVNLNVLKRNLDPALTLMADIVTNPAFPQAELDRMKKTFLGNILQEKRDPFGLAARAFSRELYGPGHPYAQPQNGTEASVQALQRDQIVSYYRANYIPNNAGIVLVGDITIDEAKAKLEKAFSSWKQGTAQPVTVPDPSLPAKTRIVIVDKPGSPQSMIVAGSVGLKRSSPDWTAVQVVNNALGGQFISRVNMNLRENKGFTYGASTWFSGQRGTGASWSYAPVQAQSTKEAVFELVKEIRDIVSSRPLAGDELRISQEQLLKGFQSYFEDIGTMAASLGNMVAFDLPDDNWQTFDSRVTSVDAAKAMETATKYLHPDALIIVVVGDKEKIEPGLKELNLGEVVSIDPATL